ncbi:HAD hydrolase-like protein [Streptomyces avermitilis]|uniref:HAD family hydrolase n=1 Tax=Streptomyces avermitilis TaxID=33903 RepID=UPI0033C94A25
MPLLMLDLDNTLVDRDAAFRAAATALLAEHALPETDIEWLMTLDASGYTPKSAVAKAMADRYGAALPVSSIRTLLDRGAADRVVLAETIRQALTTALADGWTCVIVTNGRVAQQESKIRNTGLDRLVQGWVISEGIGCKKPGSEIFHTAAEAVGGERQSVPSLIMTSRELAAEMRSSHPPRASGSTRTQRARRVGTVSATLPATLARERPAARGCGAPSGFSRPSARRPYRPCRCCSPN